MRNKIFALLFVLTIGCSLPSASQVPELKFIHITSENGLPQNTIHGIVKDKYGFMWFGTWAGLCRYDGYRFKVYNYQPGNPRSISSNRIHNIALDKNKDIWIQTFDETAFLKYNYLTDDFQRIPVTQMPVKFRQDISRWVHYRQARVRGGGFEWKIDSATNTLIRTNLKTGASRFIVSNPSNRWSLNDSYVADIYRDDQNIFWVGTYGNGINKANLMAKPFYSFNHDPVNRNTIIDDNVNAICKDNSGNFWIGTGNKGISVIRRGKPTVHLQRVPKDRKTLGSDHIRKIFCDSRGFIWIGHKDGVDRYAPGDFSNVQHFLNEELSGNAVYGITEDRHGDIWFATWNGLYKYQFESKRFSHFKPTAKIETTRSRTILQDYRGRIWVGTDGKGISVVGEAPGGKIALYQKFVQKEGGKGELSDNRIFALLEDAEHRIWIATGNGLDLYDPRTKSFRHFTTSPEGLVNANVTAILEDASGQIWISHKKGISEIDAKTFKIINYSLKDGLQSNEFIDDAGYYDEETGKLYFGSSNGYTMFLPGTIKPDLTLPRTTLTELQILNKPVELAQEVNGRIVLKRPLYLSDRIELTSQDKSFALEFSSLHYANPEADKYAYMLEGFDKDWIYTDASRRVASYSNLEAGTYTFKVKSSNSDGIWNDRPATLRIEVAPSLWASAWAYAGYTGLFLLAVYTYHRYTTRLARLRSELRFEVLVHEKENELHKNKLDFFTNISHEIKTPLSLILAPVENMAGMPDVPPGFASQLRTLKSNGERLVKLINQLLDFRRLETSNDKVNLEQRDLVQFVEDITRSFRDSAIQKSINLRFTSFEERLSCSFDPDKVEKIIYNLLSNALKFTPDGGSIDVGLNAERLQSENSVVITVSDNGVGIPPGDLETIFQPFQQGHIKQPEGTGIGLAYSQALAELLGASISVSSDKLQNQPFSTIFTLKLPLSDLKADKQHETYIFEQNSSLTDVHQEEIDVVEEDSVDKRATILLVEDNIAMRQYLKEYLAENYHVLEAANGLEGLAAAKQHPVDVVISDVMMPEMDGLEFCKQLKQEPATSHIAMVLLTARTMLEVQREGFELGADDYVTKPFNLALLSLKINNIILRQERLREQYKKAVIIEPSTFQPVTADEKLLKRLLDYIDTHLSDPHLNVDDISDNIFVSKTQLYRKTKALTGLATNELIKQLRLKRAQHLLSEKKFSVNEIAFLVGFNDANYFGKCFKAEIGISPTEYSRKSMKD
jgi:signal transduction histidine kinase/ligand-binding sensor domain-containing protein/CheY-like chemotaxis protein